MTERLDTAMVSRGLVVSRSQAQSYIKLGKVRVGSVVITKSGFVVGPTDTIEMLAAQQYVSRAGLKLASVADKLGVDFKGAVVLDVGSSTGGFTDYALRHGADRVVAVDVGTNQLHPSLRTNPRIELHEQTDIRDLETQNPVPDVVVIDVSFVSLRDILPAVSKLINKNTKVLAMVKPQFESSHSGVKHKGVIKNDKIRRNILKEFENWVQKLFIVVNKADSEVAGANGNKERFYLLKKG